MLKTAVVDRIKEFLGLAEKDMGQMQKFQQQGVLGAPSQVQMMEMKRTDPIGYGHLARQMGMQQLPEWLQPMPGMSSRYTQFQRQMQPIAQRFSLTGSTRYSPIRLGQALGMRPRAARFHMEARPELYSQQGADPMAAIQAMAERYRHSGRSDADVAAIINRRLQRKEGIHVDPSLLLSAVESGG